MGWVSPCEAGGAWGVMDPAAFAEPGYVFTCALQSQNKAKRKVLCLYCPVPSSCSSVASVSHNKYPLSGRGGGVEWGWDYIYIFMESFYKPTFNREEG